MYSLKAFFVDQEGQIKLTTFFYHLQNKYNSSEQKRNARYNTQEVVVVAVSQTVS